MWHGKHGLETADLDTSLTTELKTRLCSWLMEEFSVKVVSVLTDGINHRMGMSTSVLQLSFLKLLCMWFAYYNQICRFVSLGSTCRFGKRNYQRKGFDAEQGDAGLLSCSVVYRP